MAPVPLPERPNLEQLRKRARESQRERGIPLHEAQRDLARSYGFANWARLRTHVLAIESLTWTHTEPASGEPAAHRLVRLACVHYDSGAGPSPAEAVAMLAADPSLTEEPAVAAVVADPGAISRLADVVTPCGPYGWSPLMYLAYSRVGAGEAATLASATLLLDAGADPNDGRYFLGYPTPFTVLTGVIGDGERGEPAHPYWLALARLLLQRGADPNDAQTLYNRQFDAADDWVPLLIEFGLGRGDGGPWRARLPELTPPPEQLVRRLLEWAVVHDQRDRVALLAAHGVDVRSPLPDGRTPIATALANGHRELARELSDLGGPSTLAADHVLASDGRSARPDPNTASDDPIGDFVGAALAGDASAVAAATSETVAAARGARPGLVVWAAALGRPGAVVLLAENGFDIDALARGDVPVEQAWQTALHTAVEHGHTEVVTTLLRLGARRDITDAHFGSTALDWARHFGRDDLVALLEA